MVYGYKDEKEKIKPNAKILWSKKFYKQFHDAFPYNIDKKMHVLDNKDDNIDD
jgi:hypothetical protein